MFGEINGATHDATRDTTTDPFVDRGILIVDGTTAGVDPDISPDDRALVIDCGPRSSS